MTGDEDRHIPGDDHAIDVREHRAPGVGDVVRSPAMATVPSDPDALGATMHPGFSPAVPA